MDSTFERPLLRHFHAAANINGQGITAFQDAVKSVLNGARDWCARTREDLVDHFKPSEEEEPVPPEIDELNNKAREVLFDTMDKGIEEEAKILEEGLEKIKEKSPELAETSAFKNVEERIKSRKFPAEPFDIHADEMSEKGGSGKREIIREEKDGRVIFRLPEWNAGGIPGDAFLSVLESPLDRINDFLDLFDAEPGNDEAPNFVVLAKAILRDARNEFWELNHFMEKALGEICLDRKLFDKNSHWNSTEQFGEIQALALRPKNGKAPVQPHKEDSGANDTAPAHK